MQRNNFCFAEHTQSSDFATATEVSINQSFTRKKRNNYVGKNSKVKFKFNYKQHQCGGGGIV